MDFILDSRLVVGRWIPIIHPVVVHMNETGKQGYNRTETVPTQSEIEERIARAGERLMLEMNDGRKPGHFCEELISKT